MKMEVIREGYMSEQCAYYHYNDDPTALSQEEVDLFNAWYSKHVPEGCDLHFIVYDDPNFGEDEVTGLMSSVWPYQVLKITRD